jgi:hypothetical protein
LTASVITTTGLSADTADQTATFAVDHRDKLKLFLRIRDADPEGKIFAQADLPSIGVSTLQNQVYRFPLSNATDLKIEETDANIAANSPYTQIVLRYFDQAFAMDIDLVDTERSFGIAVDVGTHSGVDGSSAGTTTFTTTEGGIPTTTYNGGTLIIHEGTDKGSHSIATASGTTVTLDTALTGTESNLSFTLQRSSPVSATAEEIYEKVQYLLRQASDVDSTDQTVTGKTADELLTFVGDTLATGRAIPTNPNGGGTGVVILGFDANDTNRLAFTDNGGTERTFPFVAAGTINFNANLVGDTGPAEYWMFFEYTERFTNAGFSTTGSSGASATLNSSVTNLVSELSNGDYINLTGWAAENNNGIWQLTGAPAGTGPWTAAVTKVDGETVADESPASSSLDKNPINSPDAIIVDNNSDADIAGNVPGASTSFDFDYDNNVQGGRTASTDANIILRAIGLDLAQFVETTGVITQNVGLSFSLVAPLERNYSNP